VTDPRGLAAVTGSCGAVGKAGLTLGGVPCKDDLRMRSSLA
jgi:hypothetical protein